MKNEEQFDRDSKMDVIIQVQFSIRAILKIYSRNYKVGPRENFYIKVLKQ